MGSDDQVTTDRRSPVFAAKPEARRSAEDSGFTLVELLVVIAILGILAGIVVFSVAGIGSNGQKAACGTEASTVRTAMEAYQAKLHTYPTAITGLTSGSSTFLASTPTNVDINTASSSAYTLKWIGPNNCATQTGNATP
jgi:prepilin-type N-terminal cleavage/methylation domain-containing protein